MPRTVATECPRMAACLPVELVEPAEPVDNRAEPETDERSANKLALPQACWRTA